MEKELKVFIASIIGKNVELVEATPNPCIFVRIWKMLFYKLLKICGLRVLPIVTSNAYKLRTGKLDEIILKSNREGYTSNVIFNSYTEDQQLIKVKLPDLKILKFNDVFIHGDSDFVIDKENECVINDVCYDLDNRYTAYDGLLYRLIKNNAILRSRLHRVNRVIETGVIISGKFSRNYYHELYENLIKLLVLEDSDIPSNIPIIVDDIILEVKSLKRIFDILTANLDREVLYIGKKEMVRIHEAYVISPVNKVTAHIKDRDTIYKEDFIYDDQYLMKLRSKVLSVIPICDNPPQIFISRHNVKKRQLNEDEILSCVSKFGFKKVCPECLTFDEQASLFNTAEWIIGGSGAAFSNLLFCKSGCRVLCIVDSVKYGFPIFTTIAYLVGCKMIYYGNDTDVVIPNDIHSDFVVNIDKFIHTFECLKEY